MRYRTKSVEVEAYEFTGTIASAEQLAARFPQAAYIGRNGVGEYDGRMILQTANGPTNLNATDVVIVEADGSLTVSTLTAFTAKYERVIQPGAVESVGHGG